MTKFYPKPAYFESKSQVAPNSLIFNPNISDAAKVLLLALNGIATSAPTWTPVQTDLQKRLRWGRDKMRNVLKECVKYGFMEVRQVRYSERTEDNMPGQFGHNEFEFDLEPSFLPETELPMTENQSTDLSALPDPDLPIPEEDTSEGNAPYPHKQKKRSGRAMPFDIHQKKKGNEKNPSKERKYPRPPDQQATFEWLMKLDLTDETGEVDPDTMSILAYKHTRRELEDAYCHLMFKMNENGFKPKKSIIAIFRHILKNEACPRGANSDINLAYARKFASELSWRSLEIHDKYLDDKTFPGNDINLNLEPEEFKNRLHNLYNRISE